MSTIPETISVLEEYNKWRRGDETISMPDPFEVGVAIGDAVRLLRERDALAKDKTRLDWLSVSDAWFDYPATGAFTPDTMRAAIDAAMKGTT